jgi:predicted dehydrogenase/glycine/D-amino acid oxidase-like deaminating enzyme
MNEHRPLRILLIGHGHFGRQHAMVWRKLAEENVASIIGIVVNSDASRDRLATEAEVPVYRGLDSVSLTGIDAVDIVTPTATHFELVNRILPHAHILVEKPLAATSMEAETLAQLATNTSNLLAVGHVYRFHPIVRALRELTAEIPGLPQVIFGTMLNPADEAQPDAEPSMEMLHWFDVIDLLFAVAPSMCSALRQNNVVTASLRYPHPAGAGQTNAVLRLGWEGTIRQRTLELIYRDRSLQADLSDQTITIDLGDSMRRIILPHGHSALEAELRGFAATVRRRTDPDVDAATGARIVNIASRAIPHPLSRRPSVAVIGGGIFGATCAAELGEFCDVTLIERHDELLGEASTLNQWRYHHGFHYPRSIEMIREIQECRHEFEAVYGDAIIRDVESYYATARSAQIITRERYLHICTSMGLPFVEEPPPEGVLDLAQVDLCLRTNEGVFNADILRGIVKRRLSARAGITVALEHEVVEGDILPDGRKKLVMLHDGVRRDAAFDYVVNATYANRNLLARLFGFPAKPLRFDLLELLLLEIDLPKISVTVLDGPFTSMVSMGENNMFTLSHIQHSVLATATPANGVPPTWQEKPSNRANLLRHAARYLPVLKNARYIGSRYGTRTVHALPEDVDGRPTVVVDHGFGCWSILGGKVNTSVSNAQQIAQQIAIHQHIVRPMVVTARGGLADDRDEWRDRSPVGARRR